MFPIKEMLNAQKAQVIMHELKIRIQRQLHQLHHPHTSRAFTRTKRAHNLKSPSVINDRCTQTDSW